MLVTSKRTETWPGRWLFVLLLLLFFASLLFLPARIGAWAEHLFISIFRATGSSADRSGSSDVVSPGMEGLSPEVAAELANLRMESAEMRRQLVLLQSENLELQQRLKLVADLKGRGLAELQAILVANVVTRRDSSNWLGTVGLDRGSSEGVRVGMPVTVGPFLVGYVCDVGSRVSRTRLVTDAKFNVRALAVPGRTQVGAVSAANLSEERFEGIFEGDLSGLCTLRFIPASAPVAPGWLVLTASNREHGWPEGLCIGKVSSVERDGKTCSITVVPFAKTGELGSVLLLDIGTNQ